MIRKLLVGAIFYSLLGCASAQPGPHPSRMLGSTIELVAGGIVRPNENGAVLHTPQGAVTHVPFTGIPIENSDLIAIPLKMTLRSVLPGVKPSDRRVSICLVNPDTNDCYQIDLFRRVTAQQKDVILKAGVTNIDAVLFAPRAESKKLAFQICDEPTSTASGNCEAAAMADSVPVTINAQYDFYFQGFDLIHRRSPHDDTVWPYFVAITKADLANSLPALGSDVECNKDPANSRKCVRLESHTVFNSARYASGESTLMGAYLGQPGQTSDQAISIAIWNWGADTNASQAVNVEHANSMYWFMLNSARNVLNDGSPPVGTANFDAVPPFNGCDGLLAIDSQRFVAAEGNFISPQMTNSMPGRDSCNSSTYQILWSSKRVSRRDLK